MLDRKVDDIVKIVLSEVQALQGSNAAKEKIRTAVLKAPEKYELEESEIPSISANEVLVKVEGCCLSFSDTVEFLKEHHSGYTPSFGQYGTGVVEQVGANVVDAFGSPLQKGDKVVGIIRKNNFLTSVNTWYANYVVCNAATSLLKVNSLDLDSRLIFKKILDSYGEVKRVSKAGRGNKSNVVVFGSKLEALLVTAILKANEFDNIVVVGANEDELRLAKLLGAKDTVISSEKTGVERIQKSILNHFGQKADMVLLCTGKAISPSITKRFAVSEGCVHDLSHLIHNRNEKIQKFEDSHGVNKSSFTDEEHRECLEVLESAKQKNLPLYRLISHRFSLKQINDAHWAGLREEGMLIGIFNR